MPDYCVIDKCFNVSDKSKGISLFKFPTQKIRRQQWVCFVNSTQEEGIDGKDWKPTHNSRVCSVHFLDSEFKNKDSYDEGVGNRLVLNPNAVPTCKSQGSEPDSESPSVHTKIIAEPAEQDVGGSSTHQVDDSSDILDSDQMEVEQAEQPKNKSTDFLSTSNMDTVEKNAFGPFDATKNESEEEEEKQNDTDSNDISGKKSEELNKSAVKTDAYYLIKGLGPTEIQETVKETENTIETIGESEKTKENEEEEDEDEDVLEESRSWKSSNEVQTRTESATSNDNDVAVIEDINSTEEHPKEPWQYNLETPEQCLLALISSSRLSDLTIVVKDCDEPYKVHRLILSMRSPFWEKKLYKDKLEDDTITLTEEQPLPFKHVLTYMYTGKVKFPDVQVAMSVYQLAHTYQMGNLMDQCSQYLMIYITTANVPEVFKTATLLGDAQLLHKCIQVMEVSPDAVFTAPTFIAMCRESVANLIEQELTVSSEVIVFQALLKWGRSKLESNKEEITAKSLRMELQDFLPKVRFLTMGLEEFVKNVMPSEVLSLDEMRLIQLNIVKASSELPDICNPKREKRKNISVNMTNKKPKNDVFCKVSPGVSQQNSVTKNPCREASKQKATSQTSNPTAEQVSRLSGQAFVQHIPNVVQPSALTTVVTTRQQPQVPNNGRPTYSSSMANRLQQVQQQQQQQQQGSSMANRLQQAQQQQQQAQQQQQQAQHQQQQGSTMASRLQQVTQQVQQAGGGAVTSRMQQVQQQQQGGNVASRIQQVQQTWSPAGGMTTVSQSASLLRAAPTAFGLVRTPLGPRLYAMPHNARFQR